MGRKKLTDEERAISREKRKQYLKEYHAKNSKEYYEKNKERILQQQRQKREEIKGAPLRELTNIKQMSCEEWNAYCKKIENSAITLNCNCNEEEAEIACTDLLKAGDYIKKINRRMVFSERKKNISKLTGGGLAMRIWETRLIDVLPRETACSRVARTKFNIQKTRQPYTY